jgi:hemerythrin-like metal-binding protein
MAMFEWSTGYSVKVPVLDAQHRKLFALANKLHDAMRSGEGRAVIGEVLAELVTYTRTHFDDEERQMQAVGYPTLAAHAAAHRAFIETLAELQRQHYQGALSVTVETMTTLRDWLTKHIKGTDQQYMPYMSGTGRR